MDQQPAQLRGCIRRGEQARKQLGYFPKLHGGNPEGPEARKAHPRAWEWPAYLSNPSCAWLEALRDLYAQPFAFPASISPEAGLLLHALVRNVRPQTVVETGSFIGISTIWIAAALQENGDGGVLHAFDRFDEMQKGPWRREVLEGDRLAFVVGQLQRAGLGPVGVEAADGGEGAGGGDGAAPGRSCICTRETARRGSGAWLSPGDRKMAARGGLAGACSSRSWTGIIRCGGCFATSKPWSH